MSEEQKLIIEIAARFYEAEIQKRGLSRDDAYAHWALSHAKFIVKGALK